MKNQWFIEKSVPVLSLIVLFGFFGYRIHHSTPSPSQNIELSSRDPAQILPVTSSQNIDLGNLSLEDETACIPERQYLKDQLSKFSELDPQQVFTGNRSSEQLEGAFVPRKCVYYAMKHFAFDILKGDQKASPSFSKCEKESGFPNYGNYAPCLTEKYLNIVYNTFIDVSDCLGLPQKLMMAKLFNESGFHINAGAPLREYRDNKIQPEVLSYPFPESLKDANIIGGDAGIGQFTGAALNDVRKTYPQWRDFIRKSDKASCQRVRDFAGALPEIEKIDPDLGNRCVVVKAPPNPLRALVFYGIVYKNNQRAIDNVWSREEVDRLLNEAGFSASKAQKEKMQEMLLVLSYNAGPKTAVILFKNWLISRKPIARQKPIAVADFDFGIPLPQEKIVVKAGTEAKSFGRLTADEVIFLNQEYKTLSHLNRKTRDQNERFAILEKFQLHQLSFPRFLRIYRTGWAKGYLTYVKGFADILDKNVGQGTCAPESFLSL
ncbi:MAG: hypothetical protein LW875_12220 [Proteobacteria bacterium]|jgi:hypothetical protein|nr:hypothetical protein [Pseudomonadota bacterium]